MALALPGTRQQLGELAAAAGTDSFFTPSAVIEVQYHKATLKIPSGDPSVEVNYRLEAFLRGLSVGYHGGLTPLPHETWMFPGRAQKMATVSAALLPDAEEAREHFIATARRSALFCIHDLKLLLAHNFVCAADRCC